MRRYVSIIIRHIGQKDNLFPHFAQQKHWHRLRCCAIMPKVEFHTTSRTTNMGQQSYEAVRKIFQQRLS